MTGMKVSCLFLVQIILVVKDHARKTAVEKHVHLYLYEVWMFLLYFAIAMIIRHGDPISPNRPAFITYLERVLENI